MVPPFANIVRPERYPLDLAERFNLECHCRTLNHGSLEAALDTQVGTPGFAAALARSHPTLFSDVAVFISAASMIAMENVVAAIEATARLPGYLAAVLAQAPDVAIKDFGPAGALMGYDFHLTPEGPSLIEVNTNAGGAFLNNELSGAQRSCCGESYGGIPDGRDFRDDVAEMFIAEWRLQRGQGRPATIAIVDDGPFTQFLLPEFLIAKAMLEAAGMTVVIADPAALTFDGGVLWHEELAIDLVYNRLVDFALGEERHAALRKAYEGNHVVVTPNPHNYTLFADKRNLTLLSDGAVLEAWGLDRRHREALRTAVPMTVIVAANNAEKLWAQRRDLFFKPASGYGSKATYRGEKLTRKVWNEILRGSYVAQTFSPPGTRSIIFDGVPMDLKVDVRLYTYAGATLLSAARLYRGQTTNMRTPGGGFAPVIVSGPRSKNSLCSSGQSRAT